MDEEIQQLTAIYNTIVEFFVNYSFQLLGALIIVIIGIWLGGKTATLVQRLCQRHDMDVTLSTFFASATKIIVITIMTVIAMGKIGISIAPFVAALGAASLGVGLALQSPLSNYGAGLSIILTRPFVVGDTVSIQGVTGIVREVKLACTILTDEDDVEITIPNKHIIGEVIHNSRGDTLIELEIGVSYHADADQAIQLIQSALSTLVLNTTRDSEPEVGIDSFGDSNVNIAVRLWAPTSEHYRVRYRANAEIYRALQQANIEIAFPQREVRMLS